MFEKVKDAPPGSKEYIDVGKISNFMLSDVRKIQQSALFFHEVLFTPFLILIYSGIVVGQINWVGVLVPVILFLAVFLNVSLTAKRMVRYTLEKMTLADKRTKKVNEAIVGIKVIKFNAWELVIQKMIDKYRAGEKVLMKNLISVLGIQELVLQIIPCLLVLGTFPLYNDQFSSLSAAETYSIMTLYRLILAPVQMLLCGVNA